MTGAWEEFPIEELQKKLEAATGSEAAEGGGSGRPVGGPEDQAGPEDTEVAQWRQVWVAFGQLLDSAEQTLPEPAWKLPAEGAGAPLPKPSCCQAQFLQNMYGPARYVGQRESESCRPGRSVRPISGGTGAGWRRYLAGAAVGLVLVAGGVALWWVGHPRAEGPEPTGQPAGPAPCLTQDSHAVLPLSIPKESPPGPMGNSPAPSERPAVAQVSETAQQPSSPPSASQETPAWDDQWEDALLSIQQMAWEIQGHGLFQDDPFTGIRQKIQEIQNELDQTML